MSDSIFKTKMFKKISKKKNKKEKVIAYVM